MPKINTTKLLNMVFIKGQIETLPADKTAKVNEAGGTRKTM